jgi:hypothetical protein
MGSNSYIAIPLHCHKNKKIGTRFRLLKGMVFAAALPGIIAKGV